MERKNKVMLIAAIGAVAVLITSTAVRCAVSGAAGGEPEERIPAASVEAPMAGDAPVGDEAKTDEAGSVGGEGEAGRSALDTLRSHAWQMADNPDATVTFRDGSFVESADGSVRVAAFEVAGASISKGHASLDVRIVREGEEPKTTVIAIDEGDGGLTVSSDGFANSPSYVEGGASEEAVSVQGVAEPYTGLIDGRTDDLDAAISSYCKSHVPTAEKASFDGEVFLDIPGGRVTATFHCDDKASTILSVTYADGAFSVIG